MKNPVKRLIGTIMVALVSLVVYTVLLLNIEQRHNSELIMSDSINKTDSIRGMIEGCFIYCEDKALAEYIRGIAGL